MINFSIAEQTLGISSSQRFVVKLSWPYLCPQLCKPSWVWPPHTPILTRPKRQNRMSGCILHRITLVCLSTLFLRHMSCSPPEDCRLKSQSLTGQAVEQKKWPGDYFISLYVTNLRRANNLDPIFNFTSYLRSTDGCKMILWQRAATVPSKGSILSESACWHQEQLQRGQRKVTTAMRLNVQKQERPAPGVSRSRLIHKPPQKKNRAH